MPNPNDSYDDMNPADIAAEIGKDLFPSDEPAGDASDPDAGLGNTVPAQADPQPGLTAAQARALPKSWKKEMEAHWQKADPALHDYIYTREEDILRGLQQYQQGHTQWNTLLQPYQKLLQENPNVNPVQLLQGLFNSHLSILQSPKEQRRAAVSKLLQSYGIDISELAAQNSGEANPELSTLREGYEQLTRRLAQAESLLTNQQKEAYNRVHAENLSVVQKFASDPKNKYWNDVADDILLLMKSGAVSDLPAAYELACYKNPTVRAKVIADQQATAATGENTAKPRFKNINGSATPVGKPRVGTLDDTIAGVVNKHYGAH